MKRSLNVTIATNYGLPGNEKKTKAIDTLQEAVSSKLYSDYSGNKASSWVLSRVLSFNKGFIFPK